MNYCYSFINERQNIGPMFDLTVIKVITTMYVHSLTKTHAHNNII